MNESVNNIRVPFIPIVHKDIEIKPRENSRKEDDFSSIFNRELEKLKFSGHAMKRIESRNIEVDDITMAKLNDGFQRAEAKGAIDSLILIDQKAFIVNVPNKTIVTALELSEKEDKVFTNIDSVVFI